MDDRGKVRGQGGLQGGGEEGVDEEAHEKKVFDFSAIPLRLLGFGVLTGWHFLLLFFPGPLADQDQLFSMLFQRQVLLNLSLCVFFFLFGRILDVICTSHPRKRLVLLPASMVVASLGSLGAFMAGACAVDALLVVSIVAVGAGEAMLMLLWLRFYSETSVNYSGRYLSASMVIGSIICFFTRNLTLELSLCVVVALPLISGAMLYLGGRDARHREEESVGRGTPDWDSARKPFVKSTVQFMVLAFFYGLLQGSVTPDGSAIFSISDPTSVLGVGFAGIWVAVLYARSPVRPNLSSVHKVATLLFRACSVTNIPSSSGIYC